MTKRIWFCAAIYFWLFQIAMTPAAQGEENFYWKNSYGRGVGAIPDSHACAAGKEEDAGLCYEPCKAGYKGKGPVCWQESASYGRGAGTIPSLSGCKDGKEKDAGLCYKPCKPGYKGKGPVCWKEGPTSYGRGVGAPLLSICSSSKEADAGLCYPTCKAEYSGLGPVCWGNTPPGYVDCGAGFAKDKETCAIVSTMQSVSTLTFLGTSVVPGVKALVGTAKAATAAKDAAKAAEVFTEIKPFLTKLGEILKKLKGGPGEVKSVVAELKTAWKAFDPAKKAKLAQIVKGVKATGTVAGVGKSLADEQFNEIDLLRDAANLASIADPSGVLSVVAAFMYPVYGVDYSG